MKKTKKVLIQILVMLTILIAIISISSVIYAQVSSDSVVDIVKNIPKYYVLDMEKIASQDIFDYALENFEKYIEQLINDPSIDIKANLIGGGGDVTFAEMMVDVEIYKDENLIDTVHFGGEDEELITVFSLITIPATVGKTTEEERINFAKEEIKNQFNWVENFEIEKNVDLNDKEIVLLDTEKFGTIKYKGKDIEKNLYYFIPQEENPVPEPLMIMQEVIPEIDTKIIDTIKNIPKYYVLDMQKFNSQEYNIFDYVPKKIEEYIKQLINDSSIDINVNSLEGGGNITFLEFSINVDVFKDGILCDTIHFGWEDGNQLTAFALITVPSTIEKTEEEKIKYASNVIETNFSWALPFKIEKNDKLNDKEILLLDTEKFGTIKYNGKDIEENLYAFISQEENPIPEPLMIMQEDFTITYDVLSGANQKYIINESDKATFIINANYALFENGGKVYVDNKLVDSSNYTSKSGSTIITFENNYMNSLSEGEHILKIVFNNGGSSITKFTIAKKEETPTVVEDEQKTTIETNRENNINNPQTGDMGIGIWVCLMFVSIIGIVGIIGFKKKINNSKNSI